MSQITNLKHNSTPPPGSVVISLEGNSGGKVGPDGTGNIDIVGTGSVDVVGNPGTNTLTISNSGSVPTTFDADTGSATPAAGIIIMAGGSNINTSGSGNTVTFNLDNDVTISGNFEAQGDILADMDLAAGGNLHIEGTGTFTALGAGAATFTSGGVIGTTNSAAGLVLTSNGVSSTPTFQAPATSGTVTSITAGTGITLTPSPITTTGSVALTVPVVVSSGGSGRITLTNHGVLVGAGTTAITQLAVGTTGQVLTGVTGADPVFAAPAASSISITGDSGGALTGNAFTLTGGTSGLTFAGSGTTETLGGTLVVANGGSGRASATAYSLICGGTTTTAAHQSVASVGTSGQVLASNGPSALPSFQTLSGLSLGTTNHAVQVGNASGTLTSLAVGATGQGLVGNTGADASWTGSPSYSGSLTAAGNISSTSGSISTSAGNIISSAAVTAGTSISATTTITAGTGITSTTGNITATAGQLNAGTAVSVGTNLLLPTTSSTAGNIEIAGSQVLHNYGGGSNIFVGGAGNYTLNTGTALGCTAVGSNALHVMGNSSGFNTAVGYHSGIALTSGNTNTLIGVGAGSVYTTEAGNTIIDNSGTAADSNTIRIGSTSTKCFILGINGVTVTGTAVLCSTTGQLGTIASSERYKENIQDSDDISDILKLRPVTFNWKDGVVKEKQYGLIAEEVEKVFPYLVFYKDDKPESVKYHELPVFLLKIIQEQQKDITKLKQLVGVKDE